VQAALKLNYHIDVTRLSRERRVPVLFPDELGFL
jgi:hypothetical protein